MFSFFKRPVFRLLLGFLLIALVIWILGPYLAFAGYALDTPFSQLLAFLLVVGCWLAWRLIKRLRASQASTRLASAVLRQAPREQEAQPSPEAVKLRERFEEAVGALARRGRAGHSLYDLPWYVFIGAPGSGKTTALVNSGLKFPLDQRGGRASVRGVGGTRNCDWWFADEAVFLDTAGRYTTQDSDATSDSEGWREFLALLTKYRKRRPLNGVILTISTQDLLLQSEAGREDHVDAARRRLNELTRDLQIQLPVYVMVTKCDMVAGFSEYFDDLPQEDRAQVWGVTFPYDQSLSGEAAEAFPEEFDALVGRLNDRVFSRLDAERGSRRRASIFAFPQQVAALREPLAQFIGDVFSGSGQQILLRGVYLTSGTQDGTQIDRLLGSIGRRFGVAPEAVAPAAPGRGKAFFVTRLLKEVVIGESGLAGVNKRLERRNAAWQFGAYGAVLFVLVVGVTVLFVSYGRNRTYLSEVGADVDALRRVTPGLQGASLELLLPHLDAVRAVSDSANRYEGNVPWSMRWGLYQGSSVGNSARDAYVRALDGIVLPRFAARVKQRLAASTQEPETLYLYLKTYLMLGEPEHADRKLLKQVADSEWRMPDAAPGAGTSLSKHFESLLDYSGSLRPVPLDQTLVAQARSSIKQTSLAQIMFDQLRRSYSEDAARAVHLDIIAGLGIEKVLARKSGRKLSEPIPSFYTAAVFKEATGVGAMGPRIKKFTVDDAWVWGESRLSGVENLAKDTSQVTALYERDYKRAWDELLNDLTIVPFSTVQQYRDALSILVGPQSPLKGLLKVVVDNTTIIASASGAQQPGGLAGLGNKIKEGAQGVLNSAESKIAGGSSVPPGTEITVHFDPIHRLAAGAPAPIDNTLEQIKKIRDQLLTLGPEVGSSSSLKAIADPALLDMLRTLRQDATNLPPPFDGLVTQISQNAGGSVGNEATRELDQLYRDQVVAECRARVEDRYPFGDGHAGEMSLSDFSLVFGYGGVYDKFFSEHLEKLVNTSQRQWTWRPDSVQLPPAFLGQFERATGIRQMFFDAGTKALQLGFTATLSKLDPTATRFYVDIDSQRFDAKPDRDMEWQATWPGKTGNALAMFEDRVAQPEAVLNIPGPWAFFKMVDETIVPQRDAAGGVVLSLQTRYHRGVVTILPAGGSAVPYATRDWRQFSCGS